MGGHTDFHRFPGGVVHEINFRSRIVEIPFSGSHFREGRHPLQRYVVEKQIFRVLTCTVSRKAYPNGRSVLRLTACNIIAARASKRGEQAGPIQDGAWLT